MTPEGLAEIERRLAAVTAGPWYAENRAGEAFRCQRCGHTAHADTNAALNILRAGLALHDAEAA